MSDLQQILAGTSLTVTETFTVDGDPINVDSGLPTLLLFKPDGTAHTPVPTVLDSWAGPPARSTGQYRFVLPGQPTPYKLKYKLTGTIGGQAQTLTGWVEWIGASLFTIAAMRGLRVANGLPFADNAVPAYSDTQIMDARTAVLDELQAILGFPPVPRYVLETHDATTPIVLNQHMQGELLAVRVAGTSQTLSGYHLHRAGILRPVSGYTHGSAFPAGVANITVEYVSGWERPKGECSHWAMIWAAKNLNPSGFSSATTISTPDGATYTYERTGGLTGVADLDRWLERHRSRIGVA